MNSISYNQTRLTTHHTICLGSDLFTISTRRNIRFQSRTIRHSWIWGHR